MYQSPYSTLLAAMKQKAIYKKKKQCLGNAGKKQ